MSLRDLIPCWNCRHPARLHARRDTKRGMVRAHCKACACEAFIDPEDSPDAVAARRANADAADDGTVTGHVYSRLLHLQIDFQEAGNEEAETILCDVLDDWRRRPA